jgi:hypothetical protein
VKAYVKLLLLQESEIRKAAALMTRFRDLAARDPEVSTEEYTAALWDAVTAADVALRGADDDKYVLILSAHEALAAASADEAAA